MRSTNNINTIDLEAEAAEGNVFWVVYDMDTQETLMSTDGHEGFKWKALTLSAGDNWGLSELDDTARFRTLDEARQVAEEAADALAAEYPGDGINLEIHRVRLEMVEMIQDIDCEVEHGVERAGSSEEEEGEEEDEGFEANRFSRQDEEEQADSTRMFGSQPFDPRGDLNRQRKILERQRKALENLVISNKKPKKVKQAKKKSAKSR